MQRTKQHNKKIQLWDYAVVISLILILAVTLLLRNNYEVVTPTPHSTVRINSTVFNVTLAQTETERARGLSGRSYLELGEGMLFVFDRPETYAFWMKDMQFAIDIIWIDADLNIVSISSNVTPDSYPQNFIPNSPALYVLEISAGSAKQFNLNIGDKVDLSIPQS